MGREVIAEWWGTSPDDVNENDGLPPDPNVRIVCCENCGSEGRVYIGQYEDERDNGECPVCEGTGGEIVEVEPITEDDIENLAGSCDQ